MVDRTFAIWQALYPNSYVEPEAQKQDTYWYTAGSVQDANSVLKPFYSDPQGDFWTPNSVRDHTTFGYTYPELQSNDLNTLRAAVNNLYGPNSSPSPSKRVRRAVASSEQRLYQINVRSPRNALKGNYYIDFFYGTPASEDPSTWSTDPKLIGTHTVMSMDYPNMPEVTTTGVVPLNDHLQSLLQSSRLANLSEDAVIALLTDGITWRIRQGDNLEVLVSSLPGLVVAVTSIAMELPASEFDFPKYVGNWVTYPGVTNGKPGGLNFGDAV